MRESFLIYKSFYEPIKHLSDEDIGKLFRALFEYQINKTECTDVSIKMAFDFFKNQFRLDDEKYNNKCQKNREIALKRWNKKYTNECERIQTDTNNADNEKDNEKEKDNNKSKYDLFIEYLKSVSKYKTKITKTKEGKKLFNTIEDKKQLVIDYLKHQEDKKEFSVRITSFMEDYNTVHKHNKPVKSNIKTVIVNGKEYEEHIL